MQWHLASSEPVTLRGWDDEFVLFDRASGDTHQLTWLAAEILQALEKAPAEASVLIDRFLSADPSLPADGLRRDVEACLERFRELGLVAACAA